MNGTTSFDRTNYFETVPSNQLETMLWLESDRMGYFLDAVTQEKFEVQRDTVKNERGRIMRTLLMACGRKKCLLPCSLQSIPIPGCPLVLSKIWMPRPWTI